MTVKNERFEIRINSTLKEKFLQHACNLGLSGAKLIEILIERELEKGGEKDE